MKAVELVEGLYARYPQGRTFREDVEAHLRNGYVFNTPECFLMGRAVDRHAAAERVDDPWRAFARGEQNCWLVYAAARCGGAQASQGGIRSVDSRKGRRPVDQHVFHGGVTMTLAKVMLRTLFFRGDEPRERAGF